ncbi:Syntaxin-6 [Apophysomyces sp. BC1034]|nr:Syntaxin-6 [Apophysomyces sp. BC1015]KAG0180453.1 Syntaxin-6 [Apophysomyces sp. BC1021]KAG0190933.1 Syntaxin-6 [Apophysomyces sp. BC1034]
MEEDPFVIVKRQVEEALVNASTLFDSWKRIQQTVSSPRNQELVWTSDELNASLEAIEQDLDDLDEAFAACQANPNQFHLTAAEMNSRHAFLTESRNTLQRMRNTMANPPAKNQWQSSSTGYSSSREGENSRFIEDQGQQQAIMMEQQDVHLENMSGTLVNLKEIAGTMNREIDDHVVLLDELGDQVDRTEGRLKRAMHRVTDILKKEEESKSGYCICCLIIVLIILLVLVALM